MKLSPELGLTVLRLVLGLIFIVHGAQKFSGGIEGTVGFFSSLGIPGVLAYFVALVELLGGILIIIGFGTRVFAGLFAFIMLGAIFTVKINQGFVGGMEFDLAFSIYLRFVGLELLTS
ncbi:DoxX family protein [Halobacillus faecis]